MEIDDQAIAICMAECGQSNYLSQLWDAVSGLKADPTGKIFYIFKTQQDSKVDDQCKLYENEMYELGDPAMPAIPVHYNCRCYYDIYISEDDTETKTPMGKQYITHKGRTYAVRLLIHNWRPTA